jgi:single-stranded DNA-binding protein
VTHDAEVKKAKKSGSQYADFSLAVKDKQRETIYYPIRCFGKLAEAASGIKKGTKLFVTGPLELSTFTNAEGKKQVTFRVIADTYRILGNGQKAEAELAKEGK